MATTLTISTPVSTTLTIDGVTTTYNILRHNGVEIGKRDYLGTP